MTSAIHDETNNCWQIQTDDGRRAQARFLITAIGILSAPYIPDFAGRESFHTSYWPKEDLDFSGKRVGIIGTGATAVQPITEIAKEVSHLTVF